MDTPPQEAPNNTKVTPRVRVPRTPAFTKFSCKRYVKSAVVKVKWQGITQIPGPYELFIYFDTPGGLHGFVQKVNLLEFDVHEVKFAASRDWKFHCEKQVHFELRGNGGRKICTYGTLTLADICPNVIQKDDQHPDDTDMLFSVPAVRRSLTW